MEWILGWMLRLYPPAFRSEFEEEIAAVFWLSAADKIRLGRWAVVKWLITELFSGLLVTLRLRLNQLKQGAFMETADLPARDDHAPRWVIPAILALFLVMSLPYRFYALFPEQLTYWLPILLAVLAFVGPLITGLWTNLPRWSLLYTGAVLGGVGVYVFWLLLGLLLWPVLNLLRAVIESQDSLTWRLFGQLIEQGIPWLGIGLANVLFLALVTYAPGLRGQRPRFWRDFTLLSFSLYGGILVKYFIDFDEYRFEELYVFASMAALALGAWGYLRAKTPGWRTLALLAGLTACLASMAVGKYSLVPLQEWGPWLPNRPPESERWFETLGTIAVWFWAVLFVGLPGLIQTLRKMPPDLPTPAAT